MRWAGGIWQRQIATLCVALVLSLAAAIEVRATPLADDDDDDGWSEGTDARANAAKESWAHVFAARKSWTAMHGTTWAPSTNLQQDGLRLRLVTGYTAHRYTSRQYDRTTPDGREVEHRGIRKVGDVLAGYQWSVGAWTLKAFAGVHGRETLIETIDHETKRTKAKTYGAKAVFESWFNISDKAWASADLSATAVDRAYSGRLRVGWKPHADWSLGPEVHAIGNVNGTTQRLGAFVRFDDGVHEVSASAGYDRSDGQQVAPYAAIQYMYRF